MESGGGHLDIRAWSLLEQPPPSTSSPRPGTPWKTVAHQASVTGIPPPILIPGLPGPSVQPLQGNQSCRVGWPRSPGSPNCTEHAVTECQAPALLGPQTPGWLNACLSWLMVVRRSAPRCGFPVGHPLRPPLWVADTLEQGCEEGVRCLFRSDSATWDPFPVARERAGAVFCHRCSPS